MEWLTFPLKFEFVDSWTICCLFLHFYFVSFVLENKEEKIYLLACKKTTQHTPINKKVPVCH